MIGFNFSVSFPHIGKFRQSGKQIILMEQLLKDILLVCEIEKY